MRALFFLCVSSAKHVRAVRADFDALAPETFDSTHALYAELRARCPVARSDAYGGFWALFSYDDVCEAAADSKTFTTTVQNVVPKVAFTGRRPPLHFDPPSTRPIGERSTRCSARCGSRRWKRRRDALRSSCWSR